MLITAIFLLVIFLFLYQNCRKPKGYPPGPRWWPILGCALELARIHKKTKYTHKTFVKLGDKYGPVVGLKIGMKHIVVLNNMQSMRAMLLNEDCDGRPIGFYHVRTSGARRGILFFDGQQWTEQRRFVVRYLRKFGFSRTGIATIVEHEACELVEYLKESLQNFGKFPKINNHNVDNKNNQIYKLQKDDSQLDRSKLRHKFSVIKDKPLKQKHQTMPDFYSKAEEYEEVKKISESKEMIIEMTHFFDVNVLNAIWKMVFGKRLDTGDKKLKRVIKNYENYKAEVRMSSSFFYFPILRFIIPETSGYNLLVKRFRELWNFIEEKLQYCKKTLHPNAPRGLMDVYLTALASENSNNSFNESQLIAICVDLFEAGSETTAFSLAFGFLYLILFPRVQKKAQEEIDRVIGRDRLPTLADKSKMPYLQAVVFECIRIFMGRSMSVPHRALKDTTILGYKIPKNTTLMINFSGVLLNDQFYDYPENFRPERFLDNDGNIVMPDNYFPFGLGNRRCMGEMLAKNNIFIIMSTLLQKFNFSVVPGEPQPSTEDFVYGITAYPKPFRALVSVRF